MRNIIVLFATALAMSFLGLCRGANAQTTSVAQTPPMGWNSWNYFAGRVTDKDIRDSADQIVASGMRDAGYIYVNIDDTWEGERDAQGVLHSNEKFPDMKALADYVHSRGLKIGIYSSPGIFVIRSAGITVFCRSICNAFASRVSRQRKARLPTRVAVG